MADEGETKSTTFTFRPETEKWLKETYPDAIGMNEAIRNAISDARLVRDVDFRVGHDDSGERHAQGD